MLKNKSEEFDTYHQADFQATHLQGTGYEWSLPHINWRETMLLPKRSYELTMITAGETVVLQVARGASRLTSHDSRCFQLKFWIPYFYNPRLVTKYPGGSSGVRHIVYVFRPEYCKPIGCQ